MVGDAVALWDHAVAHAGNDPLVRGHVYRHVCGHVYRHVCRHVRGTCAQPFVWACIHAHVNVYMHMRIRMRVAVRVGMHAFGSCIDMCINECNMYVDMFIGMHMVWTCATVALRDGAVEQARPKSKLV